jgi:antitoxin (DNA-binding transcriptional repressor) of toxin-antitoxin stability system
MRYRQREDCDATSGARSVPYHHPVEGHNPQPPGFEENARGSSQVTAYASRMTHQYLYVSGFFASVWYTTAMSTITLDDIQRDLPGFLDRVRAGETLLVTQEDVPLAEIRTFPHATPKLRPFGLCKGEFVTTNDIASRQPGECVAHFAGVTS